MKHKNVLRRLKLYEQGANIWATLKLLLDNYSAHANTLQPIASWLQIEIDAGSRGPCYNIWGLTLRRRIHTLPLFIVMHAMRRNKFLLYLFLRGPPCGWSLFLLLGSLRTCLVARARLHLCSRQDR